MLRAPILFAAVALLASSCGSAVGTQDAGLLSGGKAVTVKFKVVMGSQDFACGQTYTGIGNNPDAGTFLPKDARFYVHDVALTDSTGAATPITLTEDGVWQNAGVALIDAEDYTGYCFSNGSSATNLKVVGTVPEGTYTGLTFKLGVPAERNHLSLNNVPSPLNISPMYWSWTSGYRFARIEGMDSTGKGLPGGLLHLGSTACTATDSTDLRKGATCIYPNIVNVTLASFDPATNTVVFDLAKLFQDTDLAVNTAGTAGGCMSAGNDPECVGMFQKLGLPLYQDDGGVVLAAGTQTVFTKQ